jgi:hypothetical protein
MFRIRQKVPVQAGAGKIPGEEPDPGYQCPGIDLFYLNEGMNNLNQCSGSGDRYYVSLGSESLLNYGSAEISDHDYLLKIQGNFRKSLVFWKFS